eukprot:8042506-Heterocapsa_arctica.AAC.1
MKRYTTWNHDIIFVDWWACRNCNAKGPLLNKRNCTHFNEQNIDEDPDDSEHKHTKRNKHKEEEHADKKNEEDNEDPDDGIEINKQARTIAEDRQSDINKAKQE